jgi:CTP:molybdopterin cytidylyltransferase MocA
MEQAARLTGDHGAGPLLKGATLLDPPSGMLRDVDTPDDLAEVERQLLAR